jgi:hypothetical protein
VRDRSARVNCAVLPFSCKVDVDMKAPQAAEVGEIERLHQAASAIQRAWRAHCTRKMLDQANAAAVDSEALARSAALSMADFGRRSAPRRLDSMLAAVETVEGAGETTNKPWQLIDDIVMHLADEQGDDTTRTVLLQYKQESQVGFCGGLGCLPSVVGRCDCDGSCPYKQLAPNPFSLTTCPSLP